MPGPVHSLCSHPAIPHLHDYFFDEDGSIELVMDLMEGGWAEQHKRRAEPNSTQETRQFGLTTPLPAPIYAMAALLVLRLPASRSILQAAIGLTISV